jgi:hypothetical protein
LMKDEARKRPPPPPHPLLPSTTPATADAQLSPNIPSKSSATMARSSTLADFASPTISSSTSLVFRY